MKLKKLKTAFAFSVMALVSADVFAADVNFSGAIVANLEVRTTAWGGYLIMNILKNGTSIKLCSTAITPTAIAIPLSDPTAKNVQAIATSAMISGRTVSGWGLDVNVASGQWCGIGNLVIQ